MDNRTKINIDVNSHSRCSARWGGGGGGVYVLYKFLQIYPELSFAYINVGKSIGAVGKINQLLFQGDSVISGENGSGGRRDVFNFAPSALFTPGV